MLDKLGPSAVHPNQKFASRSLEKGGRRAPPLAGRDGWGSNAPSEKRSPPARKSAPTSPFQGEVEQVASPRPQREAEFSYAIALPRLAEQVLRDPRLGKDEVARCLELLAQPVEIDVEQPPLPLADLAGDDRQPKPPSLLALIVLSADRKRPAGYPPRQKCGHARPRV